MRGHELVNGRLVSLLVVGLQDLLGSSFEHSLCVSRGHEFLGAFIDRLGLRRRELARLVGAGDLLGTLLHVDQLKLLQADSLLDLQR